MGAKTPCRTLLHRLAVMKRVRFAYVGEMRGSPNARRSQRRSAPARGLYLCEHAGGAVDVLEGCEDGVGVDGDGAVDVGFVDVAAAEGGEVADTAKDISDEKLKRCSSNGIEVGGCRSAR